MPENQRQKVREGKKITGRIEQQQQESKEVLVAELPVFKQLSPLWQDFYYHLISKVKS